jgi:hypothetical protein
MGNHCTESLVSISLSFTFGKKEEARGKEGREGKKREGKKGKTYINPTLAMPVRATSKPTPAGPPPPLLGVRRSRLSLASFAFNCPRW